MQPEFTSHKDLERAKTFTDAVFAIVLTLLALELRFPEHTTLDSPMAMWNSIGQLMPKLKAFMLSAIFIGGNWISVVQFQRMLTRIDLFFMADLVIYLIIISLMPFCCAAIGNYPENPVSFVLFGGVCQLLVINAYFFIRHCRRKSLFHTQANIGEIKKLEKTLLFTIILICILIALAFVNTLISFLLFLIYTLIPFVITNRLEIRSDEIK